MIIGYHTNYNGTLFSMINGYTKIHGELVPYFQTQPPWITCQLSVARYHYAW